MVNVFVGELFCWVVVIEGLFEVRFESDVKLRLNWSGEVVGIEVFLMFSVVFVEFRKVFLLLKVIKFVLMVMLFLISGLFFDDLVN